MILINIILKQPSEYASNQLIEVNKKEKKLFKKYYSVDTEYKLFKNKESSFYILIIKNKKYYLKTYNTNYFKYLENEINLIKFLNKENFNTPILVNKYCSRTHNKKLISFKFIENNYSSKDFNYYYSIGNLIHKFQINLKKFDRLKTIKKNALKKNRNTLDFFTKIKFQSKLDAQSIETIKKHRNNLNIVFLSLTCSPNLAFICSNARGK